MVPALVLLCTSCYCSYVRGNQQSGESPIRGARGGRKRELASAANNTPRTYEQVHPEILIQPQTPVQAWHRGGLQGLYPIP